MAGSDIPVRPSYDPQDLLNAQPVMVAVIDPDTYKVQFQNQTGLQKLGDISGRSCYEAIAGCPAPCAFCKMPQALSTGQVTVNEVTLPNNQYLLVQWSKAVTKDGQTHIIETITDVTAQRRVEETARKSEKMEALSRMAGGMAHDINNLLTVIAGASELVSRKIDNSASASNLIHQIQSAVERAAALTRRLVAFSHHQVVQPSLLDLNVVVKDLEPRIRSLIGDKVLLELAHEADSTPFVADRQQIEQIITVLVSNACDAMPQGGRLSISTAVGTIGGDIAEEQAVKAGIYVQLKVRDTGCGIAPELQKHLFEPFFVRTAEETGRGLGLASVYGIVRQNGGFIDLTSEPDVGTVFTVNLPWSEQHQPVRAWTPQLSVSNASPLILLVEDDEDVRLAVSDMLKLAGYPVQEACDGMDALHQLQHMSSPPGIILTDVMMPRMTGPQLAKQIHAMMPSVHVLYMSGYTDQILDPVGEQPVAFIHKPFSAKELIQKVRETIGQMTAARG